MFPGLQKAEHASSIAARSFRLAPAAHRNSTTSAAGRHGSRSVAAADRASSAHDSAMAGSCATGMSTVVSRGTESCSTPEVLANNSQVPVQVGEIAREKTVDAPVKTPRSSPRLTIGYQTKQCGFKIAADALHANVHLQTLPNLKLNILLIFYGTRYVR